MTPKGLLDLLAMPLGLARPTSTLSLLQMLHIVDERVTATDGFCTAQVDMRGTDVLRGLDCCVEARRFNLALTTLDAGGNLTITQSANGITLRCAGGRRVLPTLSSEGFPLPATADLEFHQVPDPHALASAITFLLPAVAVGDASRHMLNGMNAHLGALAGSDGYRAHHVEGAGEAAGVADGAIIPRGALDKLLVLAQAAAADREQPMQAGTARNANSDAQSYVVQFSRWLLTFQLIGARTLPFDRVVPTRHAGVQFTARRRQLAAASRNVARFESKFPAAVFSLQPKGGDNEAALLIELRSKLATTEEITDSVAVGYDGSDALQLPLNPIFFADALDALAGDEVTVSFDGTGRVCITGADPLQRCVVQTMKL